MALKHFVKVGGVNNLSDARYCAGMEVNLLGFDFNPASNNYTSPEKFKEIAEWISGVQFVGEFHDLSSEQIKNELDKYTVEYIEISNVDALDDIAEMHDNIILTVDIHRLATIPQGLPVQYIAIAGNEMELNDELKLQIREVTSQYKVLLGVGVTSENVESIISDTGSYGVDLQGGNEIRPGYKDYDELADVLEVLEDDDF